MKLCSLLGLGQDVKRIAFFGLGVSNLGIIRKMSDNVDIVIRSDTPIKNDVFSIDKRITAVFDGDRACDGIDDDVIIFSPSVRRDRPELMRAKESGVVFSSECEIFCENYGGELFAITGSDGKSTSATITSELLGGATLCGNIGREMPLENASDRCVAELSSFQLTYARPRAVRAGITNVTPNHLNWHTSFDEYKNAKMSLIKSAKECVLSADDAVCEEYLRKSSAFGAFSTKIGYAEMKSRYSPSVIYTAEGGYLCRNGEPYIKICEITRREEYNLKNFMLALAMCDGYTDIETARRVAGGFTGLAHRCETVATYRGIRFIDSSIDTSPERCKCTLSSINGDAVIILGGRKKGLSLDPMVEILKNRVRCAVVMGECKSELADLLSPHILCITADGMEDAVALAIGASEPGDSVILSPAATSYDAYSSYAERGDDFKKQVFKYINSFKM